MSCFIPCTSCKSKAGCEIGNTCLSKVYHDQFQEQLTPKMRAAANVRTPLLTFVVLMEEKLCKNDHKTGWRHLPVDALIRLMKLELEEFAVADEFFPVTEARKELVDVANFCMMLHDRLGMLNQDKTRESQPLIIDCDTGVKS